MTNIRELYFQWLLDKIFTGVKEDSGREYTSLMLYLFDTVFYWSIPQDENRHDDGINLREVFFDEYCEAGNCLSVDEKELIFNPKNCSVLEMMVALAIRSESIMYDPDAGNHTGVWFWAMITSMNLQDMTDSNFNETYVRECVRMMLDREYYPNGEGGLFTIWNCKYDLRDVEIWYQMCWYLNDIVLKE